MKKRGGLVFLGFFCCGTGQEDDLGVFWIFEGSVVLVPCTRKKILKGRWFFVFFSF